MSFALIGDIIKSKSLLERSKIQDKLKSCLNDINREYKGIFKKHLLITLGDEFQGLFNNGKYLLEIIHKIELEMHPIKIRFGIGIGNIDFDNGDINDPFGSDGPAWWCARQAIEEVERLNSTNKQEYYSNIYIVSQNVDLNNRVNTILNLCFSIKTNWTKKQIELIKYTILNYGLNDSFIYKDIAFNFNQSVSTIYGKYRAAIYANYLSVMDLITNEIINEGNKNTR